MKFRTNEKTNLHQCEANNDSCHKSHPKNFDFKLKREVEEHFYKRHQDPTCQRQTLKTDRKKACDYRKND